MSLSAEVRLAVGNLELDPRVEAAAGEPVALVGANEAGKTTLLRALAGLVPLSGGRVVLARPCREPERRGGASGHRRALRPALDQ